MSTTNTEQDRFHSQVDFLLLIKALSLLCQRWGDLKLPILYPYYTLQLVTSVVIYEMFV